MIKRALWLAAGVAIGVLAVRKVSATRQALGPAGLNRAAGRLADSISEFAEAFHSGMNEREADLRSALGVENSDARSRRD